MPATHPVFADHLTLREAIAAHRASLGDALVLPDDPEVAEMFEAHDACHAVFGCGTDFPDEAAVDTWTLTATTMTFRRYLVYARHPAVAGIFEGLTARDWVVGTLAAIPASFKAWWRGRKVTTPWAFDRYADHLDTPLSQIRRTHGIVPLR